MIGWDIGGAHLKAVLLDGKGQVVQVCQVACPLWLGLDQLDLAFSQVLKVLDLNANQVSHAVTMTGELVDLFENRQDGVEQIAQLATSRLGSQTAFYYMSASEDCFLSNDAVAGQAQLIASANWHASARLLAQHLPHALLIDIGSTTTDIIAVESGVVASPAYTDAARMQADELVYTGVVRTPVMALTQKLMLNHVETNVAAEYFATMADVYRLTRELPEAFDMAESADGAEKTASGSARRLARMVGYDREDMPMQVWRDLALDCRARQLKQVKIAASKKLKQGMTIVGAGAGQFLVKALAAELSYPYTDFAALLSSMVNNDSLHAARGLFQADVSVCLPAYAVAKLALLEQHK